MLKARQFNKSRKYKGNAGEAKEYYQSRRKLKEAKSISYTLKIVFCINCVLKEFYLAKIESR